MELKGHNQLHDHGVRNAEGIHNMELKVNIEDVVISNVVVENP